MCVWAQPTEYLLRVHLVDTCGPLRWICSLDDDARFSKDRVGVTMIRQTLLNMHTIYALCRWVRLEPRKCGAKPVGG
jgi:hypothetical protein